MRRLDLKDRIKHFYWQRNKEE
uniref:Uncharacterized protein n=1 Tax=Rhizophora mucronata TaxID=61149 RepID=A0A2P2NHL1_RHIMU